MGRGGWQVAVHRVTQSWTSLKQLSTNIESFLASGSWHSKHLPSWSSLLPGEAGAQRALLAVIFLCCLVHQAPQDHHLWGLSLLVSCWLWRVGRERLPTVLAPSPAQDSAPWPCLHGCPAFLQGHSQPDLLPHMPSGHLPQSPAALTLGSLSNPNGPAPSDRTYRGTCVLDR